MEVGCEQDCKSPAVVVIAVIRAPPNLRPMRLVDDDRSHGVELPLEGLADKFWNLRFGFSPLEVRRTLALVL